ncbi:MAG: NADH-quinone oxidoreductase subunit H [Candidatus Obscuribacterales bacterium]|nr:NADH-quinone oxidoreductase subunit H [Candidatus Obscuribacterales bacterium]
MTTAVASDYNINEIWKFVRISGIWLCIIFGAVWAACYLVGEVIPSLILASSPKNVIAENIAHTITLLTPLIAVMVFIPINATYMVLAERRGLALLTVRKGPNRVGPDGFLQTGADAVKLLFKENIDPEGCDTLMFTLAPIIFFAPSVFGAIPLLAAVTSNHEIFRVVDLPTGFFYVLAMSSIPTVGIVMGGWASNNKYSLVGGLRSAAQAVSYEIPLVLSIITICLLVGTLDVVHMAWLQNPINLAAAAGDTPEATKALAQWTELRGLSHLAPQLIVEKGRLLGQLGDWGLLNWNIFGGDTVTAYLTLVREGHITGLSAVIKGILSLALIVSSWLLCGLYLTGACAEINRIPFDLPEAESELVSGYNTEYSGIRFAIFFLAEFTNLFIVSTIAVVIWFGGGSSPFPAWMYAPALSALGGVCAQVNAALAGASLPPLLDATTLSGAIWAIAKTYFLIYFAILVRGTLPRFRIDQLMDFGWKRLIPLALILLLAVTFLKELI